MIERLKPCPFCGSAAELVMNTVGQFCAQCTNYKCGATIIAEVCGDAVDAWNRRNGGVRDKTKFCPNCGAKMKGE